MSSRLRVGVFLLVYGVGLAAPQAAGVSEQQADAFAKKLATLTARGVSGVRGEARGPQRTPFTEVEVNSWFAYRSQEMLPTGVTDPRVTIVGDGKLRGAATVDLEAVAKRRATGRALDPWSYLGGRLPVTVSGVLRTQRCRAVRPGRSGCIRHPGSNVGPAGHRGLLFENHRRSGRCPSERAVQASSADQADRSRTGAGRRRSIASGAQRIRSPLLFNS